MVFDLPLWTLTDTEGKPREAKVRNRFQNLWKNTIFNEHPVAMRLSFLGVLVFFLNVNWITFLSLRLNISAHCSSRLKIQEEEIQTCPKVLFQYRVSKKNIHLFSNLRFSFKIAEIKIFKERNWKNINFQITLLDVVLVVKIFQQKNRKNFFLQQLVFLSFNTIISLKLFKTAAWKL